MPESAKRKGTETPPWGRALSFRERILIALRLDPAGRRRPPVPNTAYYSHSSFLGMVHDTAEIKTIEDGVELAGTRLTLSYVGGLISLDFPAFVAPAVQKDWVEIFYAKIPTVDVPYPIYFHNKRTNTLGEMEHSIRRCAVRHDPQEEIVGIALVKREVRYFAYEKSGVTA
ncbi:hypothetical protein EJ076_29515 [Mesorhizobium sp. M7D.F.Ca.US.005.01.1.1]|uniref:hypothetical protein n=1 Tax=Mesorhizobium sp. M7D.F.Ca.US.005.01.1.1 TaxID=2493678 RepID=UPI000F751BFF|nr:hypothetical protein [Mesorhizobium sp. M7D.F.Ca.US.005.01.1.1]AZO44947.1 hypothetical protein EJ076_29515 [Mesorhizobium sp. M7D.F.Ca.US.005.01.1.1]